MVTLAQEQNRLAHVALSRFGLGAKPGGISKIRADAKAAVLAELNTPNIAQITVAGLPTYVEACQAMHKDFALEEMVKERELTARIYQHMVPEVGFVERLVLFFSNHFSMSINKDGAIRATVGQLERDVIRRHVLGNFEDMLIGVIRHPAMLKYLDNDESIGPNSVTGLSWGAGMNLNLAREILELQTLGVAGGYTEADILGLARALTGWSFVRGWEADGGYNGGHPGNRGQFIFRFDWHEPGSPTVLGQTYNLPPASQGAAILRALARHPSTAQFLAFKLVRHFITDAPTPELVNPVADAYRSSGGNLRAIAQALINLPQAWTAPLKKLRTPYELQIAEMRAMQRMYVPKDRWPFDAALYSLRNKPWEHPTPDGYSDDSAYWMGPDGMRIRVETAHLNAWALLQRGPYARTAPVLADMLFATQLSSLSRQAVVEPANLQDGLAILFMIPEFQRR